jgi:lysophospholipase L1-like esterase
MQGLGMRQRVLVATLIGAAFTSLAGAQEPEAIAAPFAGAVAAFKNADAISPPPRCATLFVGSSSFRLWTTLAEDMAPRTVINRGFGGSQMTELNAYFDDIVAPYAPREILIYEGDNDLWLGVTPEQLAAEVARFMDFKTEALGATPVYFVSVKPSRLRFHQLDLQTRANALVSEMAEMRHDLLYIDVATPMLDEDGLPRDVFILDGLHMTAEGYAIWAPIIRAALDAGAPTQAPGCE